MTKSKYWLYQRFLEESSDPDSNYYGLDWPSWHNERTCYVKQYTEKQLLKIEKRILEKITLKSKENEDA